MTTVWGFTIGEDPVWDFEVQPNKTSVNEGDHIATDSTPVWTETVGNIPITAHHTPCGYWWKK